MPNGKVMGIYLAPEVGEPTESVDKVNAVAGKGLEGDRYFHADGLPADNVGLEATLIETEVLEDLQREEGVALKSGESRRQIETSGVRLNDLVDREFRVGEVVLRGVLLCEPCSHLASMTDAKVLPGLVHRGGLRTRIVTGGVINVGDAVEVE